MNHVKFILNNNIPAHFYRNRKTPTIMSMHLLKPGSKFRVLQEWRDTGVPYNGVWEKTRGTTAINQETGEKAIFACTDIVQKL